MEEKNNPNQNENSNLNEKVANSANFNVSQEGGKKEKKGKNKTAIISAAVLLVVIVLGLIYYFANYTKPDQMYKRLVGSSIDSYTAEMKSMNYKTSKTSFKLDADLDTDKIDKNVTDLINKTNLEMDVQTNNEDKQFVMNLKANYEQEDLLDIQMYSDVDKEKTYMQFKNFLDKYIEVEDMDDEFYTYFEELLEKQKMTGDQKKSLQKASNILKKELTSAIKDEYCTAKKEEITVNGKSTSAKKNTIKMNQKQFKEELTTIFENLKDNKEFSDCFEDKEKVTETLERCLEELEDFAEDEKSTIEIAVYTNGWMQKIQKVTLTIASQENEETITMEVTKTEKDVYDYELLENNKTICKGNVKLEEKNKEEGTILFELEGKDFGTLKLNIEYAQKYNQNIDEVDVKDAIKSDELTESDQEELMKNLQKSKLYELIASFSGVNNSDLLENTTKEQTTTDIFEEEEDNDSNDSKTTSTKENEIASYDGKQKITFKMPESYQLVYKSDEYKSFEKDDISIRVATAYGDKDEYYKDLQEKKKYYEEDSYYNNVTLSDMSTIEVKGKTFYRATFSYQYADKEEGDKEETTYLWSKVSDESVVDFEIKNSNAVTPQELEEILTIEIQKN